MIDRLPADLVVLDAKAAGRLGVLARHGLEEVRRINGGVVPPEFLATWSALDRVLGKIVGPVSESGRPGADDVAEWPVSVAMAAFRLGRTERTVTRWLNEGKLSGQRVGRQWQVDPRSLDELEETHAA